MNLNSVPSAKRPRIFQCVTVLKRPSVGRASSQTALDALLFATVQKQTVSEA